MEEGLNRSQGRGVAGLTGPSTWLGWGGFSWRSVLSLVPGIWEDPSVRDLLAVGREKGRLIMAPGSSLTKDSLLGKVVLVERFSF